jgi:hypothetical protein
MHTCFRRQLGTSIEVGARVGRRRATTKAELVSVTLPREAHKCRDAGISGLRTHLLQGVLGEAGHGYAPIQISFKSLHLEKILLVV